VIWIDHKEARTFHVHPDSTEETTVFAPRGEFHRQRTDRDKDRDHPEDTHRFFADAARSLDGADAILIVGPSSAKLEFFRYLHEHDRRLEQTIVGVESVAHATDGEILEHGRGAFAATR